MRIIRVRVGTKHPNLVCRHFAVTVPAPNAVWVFDISLLELFRDSIPKVRIRFRFRFRGGLRVREGKGGGEGGGGRGDQNWSGMSSNNFPSMSSCLVLSYPKVAAPSHSMIPPSTTAFFTVMAPT